ncbi:MAG: AAA family ATPase [SAR324 cluster bacterium]|nr:AAA family ATPase [SAR324 cluster bacterium]
MMMPEILDYKIEETVYQGGSTLIFRGTNANGQRAILKTLQGEYPSQKLVRQLKREYQLLQNMRHPGVIQSLDFKYFHNIPVMLLEDIGGQSLSKFIKDFQGDLTSFLNIAVQLTDALAAIHHQRIIHKDLNPSNIIYSPEQKRTQIIDLSIAVPLYEKTENQTPALDTIEGTLHYVSPEQTGRINCEMDWRTDFYSLGVTFYELLTGRRPFLSEDPMELVYYHIAQPPTPPHQLNAHIPRILSDLILKLMSKDPEDRYQSAFGLKHDLMRCQTEWNEKSRISPFPLEDIKRSSVFKIPHRFYGRENEVEHVRDCFRRVCEGNIELIVIQGKPGLGKSALVRELHGSVVSRRGFYISGKFDVFNRNMPYTSIIQALNELILQLLSMSEAQILFWKQKLIKTMTPNLQVVIDVIPELETIVGKQPSVPELSPKETQNRFRMVFQAMIRLFAQAEHPLVLFLDDFQWADTASRDLLNALLDQQGWHHLLIILAVRDENSEDMEWIAPYLEVLKQGHVHLTKIDLHPWNPSQIVSLLTDMFHCAANQCRSLAEVIHAKTQGNPFFVQFFLKTLYSEKLIEFDEQKGAWKWEPELISQKDVTENVFGLIEERLQGLTFKSRQLLNYAACLGQVAEITMISKLTSISASEVVHHLWPAVEKGLLTANFYWEELEISPEMLEERTTDSVPHFSFAHDRIRQTVYDYISQEERIQAHHLIGKLLYEHVPEEKKQEQLFHIVNHFNSGKPVHSEEDRLFLVELNKKAALKAHRESAFEVAFQYLTRAIRVLGKNCWDPYPQISREIYLLMIESSYLNGHYQKMEKYAQQFFEHVPDVIERARVYEIRIQAHMARNELNQAVDLALTALETLGVKLSRKPGKIDLLLLLQKTRFNLWGKTVDKLNSLRPMQDKHQIAIMRILSRVKTVSFFVAPELYPVIIFHGVNLSLKYGNTPFSADAYVSYGMILCSVLNKVDEGFQFGLQAIELVEHFRLDALKCRITFLFSNFIEHWKNPVRSTLPTLKEAMRMGVATGDLEYASLAAFVYSYHSFAAGIQLDEIEKEMFSFSTRIQRFRQETALHLIQILHQTVLNFSNVSVTAPCLLKGGSYDENKMRGIHQQAGDKPALFALHFLKGFLCYFFENYDLGQTHMQLAERYIDGARSTFSMGLFTILNTLCQLATFSQADRSTQIKTLKQTESALETLGRLSQHSPENYLTGYYLVSAENARVRGHRGMAMDFYDQAIDYARNQQFLYFEALANELAGKFYFLRGREQLAKVYLRQAHFIYNKWGALNKVRAMETQYPAFFYAGTNLKQADTDKQDSFIPETTSVLPGNLDFMTVMKASQAISSEIILDRLLKKMMQIVMENAGAQKGALLLRKKNDWFIQAEGSVGGQEVQVMRTQITTQIDSLPILPLSLIYLVIRTQNPVILANAMSDEYFHSDPYFLARNSRSVLCFPILHKTEMTGILYLENNLMESVFTSARLEILKLLSAQMAISIENAQLYEDMAKTERLSLEMETARAVQELLIPKKDPFLDKVQIASYYQSASETGGDWYNYQYHEEIERLDILIGDVTGHGIPAALITAMVNSLFMAIEQNYAKILDEGSIQFQFRHPSYFMEVLNNVLYFSTSGNYTMTFLYSVLDLRNHNLIYTSAGHTPIYVYRPSGFEIVTAHKKTVHRPIMDLSMRSSILGSKPDNTFKIQTLELQKDDVIIWYTDGLIENYNLAGESFGATRLKKILKDVADKSALSIRNRIIEDAYKHYDNHPQEDDITLIVAKITG